MINKLHITFSITFFIIIHLSGNAQHSKKSQFLINIGSIDSLYSKTLQEDRTIYIQLPDNYSVEKTKKYPVVYILDGEILLSTVANVQSFYNGGFTPDMILVGISNAKNRTRDLTTSKITTKYGMPFSEENGEATNFSTFIASELIPYIEKKYRVTSFRTLIGHSYGGLFTIDMLLNKPQLFTNYIAIDPSLDWDNQKLIKTAKEKLTTKNYKGKSLFMSLSSQLHLQNPTITLDNVMKDSTDFTLFSRSNIAFSNLIKENIKNELAFKWQFYPMDIHGTIPFPSIKDGLLFDFNWFQMENTDQFNSPETSKEDLKKLVNYRAKKLENYFGYIVPPYPEDLFNALGYMSLDMEQTEKAKMFFEFTLLYYPTSANAYDSMSEFYERTNQIKEALKYATKAYELNADTYFKQSVESLKKIINNLEN